MKSLLVGARNRVVHAAIVAVGAGKDRARTQVQVRKSDGKQQVEVNGEWLEFSGEASDPFYTSLPYFHADNKPFVSFVQRSLAQNAVCYDIGANIGLTAAVLGKIVNSGSIFAFEPSPINGEHLRANMSRNGLTHVTVIEKALGADEGTVDFVLPNAGANSQVLRSADTGDQKVVSVPLATLDSWRRKHDIPLPEFMKIDVEGFELDVLYGAAETIVASKAPIYMEFNSLSLIMDARTGPMDFAEYLFKYFTVSRVSDEGGETRLDNAYAFTLENLTKRGLVEDVLLRIRSDVTATELRDNLPRRVEAVLK